MAIDITRGKATVNGQYDTILIHWGTRFTRELEYKKQVELLGILESSGEDAAKRIAQCESHYNRLMRKERIKRFAARVKNKILRTIGIKK